MIARTSIEHLAEPVPHADSWPARRPPSVAYDAAVAMLEARATRVATHMIKHRARAYMHYPRELNSVADGLFNLSPSDLVTALTQLRAIQIMRAIPAINLRSALLYSRFARAKANQLRRRMSRQ